MNLKNLWRYFHLSIRVGIYKTPFTSFMIFLYFIVNRVQIKLKMVKLILPPPNLVISLTSRCNKTCSFCHYVTELNSPTYKEDELTLEGFKTLLRSKSVPNYGRVCLYGGEPLLNKDFFSILKLANNKKYLTTIVTNGLLVGKYLEELKNSKLNLMTLSYYKEDIEKIRDSIKKISSYIPINVSYVVSNNRLDELKNMLEFSKDINAEMVTIENLRENGVTNEKTLFESKELRAIQKSLNAQYSDHFILRWSGFNTAPKENEKIRCIDFWDTIFLNAKGEVSPCCQYPLSSYKGSIESSCSSINSKEMISLRKSFINNIAPDACKGCHYLYKSDPLYKS
ncbi:putative molybdenum cofactor biosynthesis protein [Halobacteriovorax marinus SJ]|uniref:Molybdenum cofactor biosynthesis protein n=1 Tax=Halobacteriovorax marinus (strain ATCC BAA-682 / DSM 15412 / SJ) TaxID=862908 RepID=E1WZU7_HALMS|nr:radical SAM protein [Halobacteriovorax marinus]CBW27883.1 putative molybdenum cofactor biosynthesis protein [Halobacteriovorax marinus SJ]